ncbi:calcium-binding EF-hand [Actibacterium atlanticum]|uniref:Calcium-binding EF-hand n=1 Tax=Actibacterium atlanticum TaxID=1461693 RepID=A0A058ZQH9_9RHOB|nr:hypothetical protein [Actibacterium atlanticum]KCV83432.1 calcium-binding EF-hand [Actibacterium atlanticum]
MKFVPVAATVLFGLTVPALAQDSAPVMDADADGVVTIEEIRVVYPELTEEAFAALDVDGDGVLNVEETAVASETLMAPQN